MQNKSFTLLIYLLRLVSTRVYNYVYETNYVPTWNALTYEHTNNITLFALNSGL